MPHVCPCLFFQLIRVSTQTHVPSSEIVSRACSFLIEGLIVIHVHLQLAFKVIPLLIDVV